MRTTEELMQMFDLDKSFNVRSTVINDNIRVSTACIFYEDWFFGKYYQKETFIFKKEGQSIMKIHDSIFDNTEGIEYLIRFHNKAVSLVKSKLSKDR